MLESHSFSVPYLPPSVNHYLIRVRNSARVIVKREAKKYKEDMALLAGRNPVGIHTGSAKSFYEVTVRIFLGADQKGDIDNYQKLILDGIKDAGLIHSDDAVLDLDIKKRRDRNRPRVDISIKVIPRPEGY